MSKEDESWTEAFRILAGGGRDWISERVRKVKAMLADNREAYLALVDAIARLESPILGGPTAKRIIAEAST